MSSKHLCLCWECTRCALSKHGSGSLDAKTADTKTDLVVSWRPTQSEPAGELVINPKSLKWAFLCRTEPIPYTSLIPCPWFHIIIVGASPPPPSVTTRTGVPTIGWGIYLASCTQHKPQPALRHYYHSSVAQWQHVETFTQCLHPV